jgi:hypothetical protein
MRTRPAYLIIDTYGRPRIVRVSQGWPRLNPSEVAVRVTVELPDGLIPDVEVVVDELASDAVAVATVAVEPPHDNTEDDDE